MYQRAGFIILNNLPRFCLTDIRQGLKRWYIFVTFYLKLVATLASGGIFFNLRNYSCLIRIWLSIALTY